MRPLLGKPSRISLRSVILLPVLPVATATCACKADKQVTVARGFAERTTDAWEWKETGRGGGATAEAEDICCGAQ